MRIDQTIEEILLSSYGRRTHFRKYSPEVNPSMVLPRDQYEVTVYDEIQKNNMANVWGMKDGNRIIMVVEVMLDEFKK